MYTTEDRDVGAGLTSPKLYAFVTLIITLCVKYLAVIGEGQM